MFRIRQHLFSPSRTILLSLGFAIIVGSSLLSLPFCRKVAINSIDILFTATSSVCVTGLFTIPLDSFTRSGHIIIMALMQIGGLGIITLTLFVISLFVNLGLATQVMAGEMLDLQTWSGTRKLLIFIIKLTALAELLGATAMFYTLRNLYSTTDALFYALFHAVSSFCNAGICLINIKTIPAPYNLPFLINTGLLVFLGGIGFITLKEIYLRINPYNTIRKIAFSLQTKIVLSYTATLISINTLIFWLLERKNSFATFSTPEQIFHAFFTALNTKSAGFITVLPQGMQKATLLHIMVNAFIGSAPASTGSGIKITTAAIFIATINSAINGYHTVDIRGRRIMKDQIYKALAIVILSMAWIFCLTFLLLITEHNGDFLAIVFETISSFTTLGMSLGLTPHLSYLGKIFIMISMFVGRIGSLTLMIALRNQPDKHDFSYPEERIMIS